MCGGGGGVTLSGGVQGGGGGWCEWGGGVDNWELYRFNGTVEAKNAA